MHLYVYIHIYIDSICICFHKNSESGGVTAVLVYVDDIFATGNNEDEKVAFKKCLVGEFEIKELEKLKYFHGT